MLDTDLAWAAGIIDGEGYIGMTKANPGVNRRKTLGFQIRISVRMTHKQTIEKLHTLFGGTFKQHKPKDSTKHRICYEWFIGDLGTIEVIRQIYKYLVTKKGQADLILRYRKDCCGEYKGGRGVSIPDDLAKLRLQYFTELAELNKRGI